MRITVEKITVLPLPSASGLEIADNWLYLIGDDSPFLYGMPQERPGQLSKWPLFETEEFETGRMPKAVKADLECLALLELNGESHLLALGSGSKKKRGKGFLIRLPHAEAEMPKVTSLDLHPLYEYLRTLPEITGEEGKLNLEGLAIDDDQVILLNRSNKAGHNAMLVFNRTEFLAFLIEPDETIPKPEQIHHFSLPSTGGIDAGFTGAFLYGNQLFFTAASEDTSDPVLDGPVHGSFLGRWQLNDSVEDVIMPDLAEIRLPSGEVFPGKVESLIITEMVGRRSCRALAVTDDDQGGSEMLELLLEW